MTYAGIYYDDLNYDSSLGFAFITSNNEHDDDLIVLFANNIKVLINFTLQATYIISIIDKELISTYYKCSSHHSYYMRCLIGDKQSIYIVLHFSSDFDKVLASALLIN